MKTFNECLWENQDELILRGTFLLMEKVRMLVYRNLFKQVMLHSETNKLPAVRWCGCWSARGGASILVRPERYFRMVITDHGCGSPLAACETYFRPKITYLNAPGERT